MKTILFVIIFLSLYVYGCGSANKESISSKTSISGIEWKLKLLNNKNVILNSGKKITLLFNADEKKFNGKAVCNTYFGSYTKASSSLSFKEIGSTKMMCDDNNLENDYFNMLEGVDSYTISYGTLSLYSKGTVIAVYNK
ncbi:MAG: META domain-containing protein [Ignavibacteria bacterium]|nr:META domain-containing protein [Ignavibacteria bacterium]